MTSLTTPAADVKAVAPKRSRWWIAAVMAALALVAGAVVFFVAQAQRSGARPAPGSASMAPGVFPEVEAMTGNQMLLALADRITDSPADTRTGTYTYLLDVVWGAGTQNEIQAVEQRTWRTPDGAIYYAEQRRRPDIPATAFDLAKASLDFTTVKPFLQDLTGEARTPDLQLSGTGDPVKELTWYVGSARQWQPATPRVRVEELAELHRRQFVSTSLRAAILRTLAALPDVAFTHKRTTDLRGRPGVGFSMTSGYEHVTLIFDPVTGQLLALENLWRGNLFKYELLSAPTWTNRVGAANPQPTPASTIVPTAWPSPRATA